LFERQTQLSQKYKAQHLLIDFYNELPQINYGKFNIFLNNT